MEVGSSAQVRERAYPWQKKGGRFTGTGTGTWVDGRFVKILS